MFQFGLRLLQFLGDWSVRAAQVACACDGSTKVSTRKEVTITKDLGSRSPSTAPR